LGDKNQIKMKNPPSLALALVVDLNDEEKEEPWGLTSKKVN